MRAISRRAGGEQAAPGLRPGPPRGSQGVCRVLVQPSACFYSETRYNSARRINLELHTQETPKFCYLARARHGRARAKIFGFPMLKLRNVWRTCGSERPFEQLRLRKWRVPVPGLRQTAEVNRRQNYLHPRGCVAYSMLISRQARGVRAVRSSSISCLRVDGRLQATQEGEQEPKRKHLS